MPIAHRIISFYPAVVVHLGLSIFYHPFTFYSLPLTTFRFLFFRSLSLHRRNNFLPNLLHRNIERAQRLHIDCNKNFVTCVWLMWARVSMCNMCMWEINFVYQIFTKIGDDNLITCSARYKVEAHAIMLKRDVHCVLLRRFFSSSSSALLLYRST